MELEGCLNVRDLEQAAKARLSRLAFDYYAGWAGDGVTLHDNEAAYQRLRLRPRALAGVERPDLRCRVLGREVASPILIAPTAFHGLAHADAELATARAAAARGATMTLSTLSNTAVEDVAAVPGVDLWFQLYVYRDRGLTRDLVERAVAAGCRAIVLTADTPVLGRREADVRNRFCLPPGLAVRNATGRGLGEVGAAAAGSGLAQYVATLLEPAVAWRDVEWLCTVSRVPVVVKGLVRGDDAECAVRSGAAAVQVSNHGGRQLDGTVASIDALEEVVEGVDGRAEVYVDGGVRRGTDVLKALALGARAVFVGRPILWGLAAGGEPGVRFALDLLHAELEMAMWLSGCATTADIRRDLVARAHSGE